MASGAAAAAGLAGAPPALAHHRKRRRVFKLGAEEPYYHCTSVDEQHGDDCEGCNACQNHAKNKLFRSAGAANGNRAHDGCRCGIIRARTLPIEKWEKLFGPHENPERDHVDLRDPRVRRILG